MILTVYAVFKQTKQMTIDKDEHRLIMQVLIEEATINPLEKIDYPTPAISF